MAEQIDGRKKALDAAMAKIEKQFGAGSVMRLGEGLEAFKVDVVPIKCLSFNRAAGCGGLPKGRVVEIYGPESSGKTTLTLHAIAAIQEAGGVAAFIDAEHALDPTYASKLGVNLNELIVSQPDSGEQALEIAETLVRSGSVDMVVVDSVAALVARAEIEGDMGDAHVGVQARLMSQALRKLTSAISESKCCFVFINQLRSKIGGMGYGPSETTTGGNALKFYASMRIDIRKIQALKNAQGEVYGTRTRAKFVKNKLAPPFREAEFDILYGEGISREGDLIDLGCDLGVIEKSGAWFTVLGERFQGRENVKTALKADQALAAKLESAILEKLSPAVTVPKVENPSIEPSPVQLPPKIEV